MKTHSSEVIKVRIEPIVKHHGCQFEHHVDGLASMAKKLYGTDPNSIEKTLADLEKKSEEMKVVNIKLKDIIFTQPYFEPSNFVDIEEDKPVFILVRNNKKYLLDGNHRCIKKLLGNKDSVTAFLFI